MAFTIIKLVIVGLVVSLLIIINSSHSSGYIYYEKPSSARLAAASHTPPACIYQNKKYAHGQQVTTQEPCLNCTCKKGVLLCFLRVCPTLIQPSPYENCVTTREPGQCCPTLKCEPPTTSIINESPTTVYSPTTASTTIANKLSISSTKSSENNLNLWKANKLIPQTNSSEQENVTLHYSAVERTTEKQPPFSANIDDLEDRTKLIKAKDNTNRITVTQKDKITTIFQTSPSTSYHESLLLVTSSPDVPLNQEDSDNLININKGSCVINGTIYAEGSAVISTSFCEYCYCIRSKRMCIRPRCHLSIMGCLPRYISEYACCPTSYVCGEQALTTLISTTTTTTTTNSIMFGRKSMCLIDGLHYQIGDAIPSDQDCKQCYCSTGAVKKCKKIQCSPAMDGCVPVIPEGHCCPVEYKCNSTQKQPLFDSDKLKPAIIEDTPKTTQMPDVSTYSVDNEVTSSIDELITRVSDLNYSETSNGNNTENYLTISDSDISNFNEDTTATNVLIQVNQSLNLSQRNDSLDLKAHSLRKEDEFSEKFDSVNNFENVTDYVNEIIPENPEESSKNPDLLELSTIDTNTGTYDSVNYRTDNSVKEPNSYTEVNSIETKDDSEIGTAIEQISTTQISLSNLTQFSEIDFVSTAQSIQDRLMVTEITTPNINSSETVLKSDDTENSANETTFEKVEDFLQGIIRAIDKHLHPAIPAVIDKHLHPPLHQHSSHAAEPRESIKENNSNEILSNLRSENDANKLPTSRGHVPLKSDMSSAFFITDSENNPPYKIHSDSESGGVEIITSKTPFHDIHNYGDSILINLTPSSLKVVPPSGNLSPSYNDRHTQTIAQNNRAPTYVKPGNSNFNLHNNMMSPNEWKIMNQNVHRRPQYEVSSNSHKSSDSLYYNGFMKRHDVVDEEPENSDKELEKRARIEVENPSDAQRMIPFKMNDAVFNAGTLSLNRKNSSFIIRLPAPSKVTSTTKTSQQTSCIYNSQEFANGAMIPKSDPCTLCRCFYGRELCQEQKCPSQPEKNCTPERVPGYCCPRYICRVTEEMIANSNLSLNISETLRQTETSSVSTIRKGPQYPAPLESPQINETMSAKIKTEYSLPDIPQPHLLPENLNHFDDMLPKEENKRFYQSVPDYPAVPAHVHGLQSKYPPFPLDPTPKTYHKINTYNHNVNRGQNENRVHFPNINLNKNNSYREPINLQPSISDSISPLIPPHPRPSLIRPSPYQAQQNSGANKYRIKPAQMHSLSNSNPTSIHGIQNRPPVRMPPFLLNNNNVPNIKPHTNQASNNLRNKTPVGALITPITSEIQQNRPVLLLDNNTSLTSKLNDSHKDIQQSPQQQVFTEIYKLSSLKPNIELEKNQDPNLHHTLTQTLSLNNLTKSFSSEVPDIGLSSVPITTEMPVKSKLFITTRMKHKTTVAPKIELTPTKQAFIPTISSTTLSTSTTTLSPKSLLVPNENKDKTWDLFRVSGCNIYGTMYNIDEEISRLSTACKKCICSNVGVKCDNIC